MTDRAALLSLDLARETGALRAFVVAYEVRALAGDREFTSAEIVAHATKPANARLRDALAAVCGTDLGAAKVGRLFARWNGVPLAGLTITAIGSDANAVVWRAEGQATTQGASDRCEDDGVPSIANPTR